MNDLERSMYLQTLEVVKWIVTSVFIPLFIYIATKFDISTRTVSIYIKLLETKGLIFRFIRKNGMYGIYRSRVIIPSKLGFQLLNMDTDKKWIIDQLGRQQNQEIEDRKNIV